MAMPRNSVWRVDIIRKGYSDKAMYYFRVYLSILTNLDLNK